MSPPPIVSRRCRRRRRLPHSSPPCRFRRCHRHDWKRLLCLRDFVDGAVRRCDRGLRLFAVRRSVSVAAFAGDQHVPTSPCRAGCGGGEPLAESGARSPCVTAALPAASFGGAGARAPPRLRPRGCYPLPLSFSARRESVDSAAMCLCGLDRGPGDMILAGCGRPTCRSVGWSVGQSSGVVHLFHFFFLLCHRPLVFPV